MNAKILVAGIIMFGLIQLIPYGHSHDNPPVLNEVHWDTPQTKALFTKACADCHSNLTKWPSYSSVAPVSWLIMHDVEEGREHLNVSMWGKQKKNKGKDAAEEVEEGEMPPAIYTVMHPEAKLTNQEKTALIRGLKATFGED